MNKPTEKGMYIRISVHAFNALKKAAQAAKRSVSAQAAVELEKLFDKGKDK